VYNPGSIATNSLICVKPILMKPTLQFVLICLFSVSVSHAQLLKPTTGSMSFSVNFEKIVQSYRNNFHSIQGDRIPSEKEKQVYKSSMTLPGTLQAFIYRFGSRQDTSASWQAIMYKGEDQQAAIKAYKSICRQVNRFRVNGVGVFKGEYEAPDENLRFAGSSFKLEGGDKTFEHFYAEVDMVLNADEEWEVYLNLVRKKQDEDMF